MPAQRLCVLKVVGSEIHTPDGSSLLTFSSVNFRSWVGNSREKGNRNREKMHKKSMTELDLIKAEELSTK